MDWERYSRVQPDDLRRSPCLPLRDRRRVQQRVHRVPRPLPRPQRPAPVERTRKHPLLNILFIAVCGVLSGANSFAGIQEFGCDRRQWFARYLDLSNGIPSDDTFARVVRAFDPVAFEKCLLSWIQAVQEESPRAG